MEITQNTNCSEVLTATKKIKEYKKNSKFWQCYTGRASNPDVISEPTVFITAKPGECPNTQPEACVPSCVLMTVTVRTIRNAAAMDVNISVWIHIQVFVIIGYSVWNFLFFFVFYNCCHILLSGDNCFCWKLHSLLFYHIYCQANLMCGIFRRFSYI